MREAEGIVRALAVLGDEIAKNEAVLRHVMNQRDKLTKEADVLRGKNKELTEQLKQAEADRDTACRYALRLEKLLESCKAEYNELIQEARTNAKNHSTGAATGQAQGETRQELQNRGAPDLHASKDSRL